MKGSRGLLSILTVFLLLSTGCGYHFSGEGPSPRPGLRRIAVPLFENKTSEPDLASLFAGALRREFMGKGQLQVVSEDEAEAVFQGRLTNMYTVPLAHRDVEETIETRIYVTLDIRCQDTQTGAILWQDNHFTFYEEYIQSDDPIISYENRRQALEVIAREMAIRIHDRFLSNF